MYGKHFDLKKPFGTVIGDSRFAFEQDGQLYNAQKEPVDENGAVMPLSPNAKAIEPELPVSARQPAPAADNPDDDIPEDEKPFDVLAWAQGDPMLQATHFAKVKAEAAALLGSIPAKKEDIRKAVLEHYNIA